MSAMPPGHLVVISGPSGAGKTTLLKRVFAECRLPLVGSVSATTRRPRRGEIDGEDYHFLSREEFARRREAGEFVECCEVYAQGDWYGTLRNEVTPSLEAGKWVVLEIDVQGTFQPASVDELERRLKSRGTESEVALARRLEVARRELASADYYRYQVTNDDLERAVREVCDILQNWNLTHLAPN
jgi:guanylate kinase